MDFDKEEQVQSFDVMEYVNIAWRGKWIILIPAVLGLIVGVITSRVLPEVYRAHSLILIEEGMILRPLMGKMAVSVETEQRLKLIEQEILSWPKLVQLVERLQLDKNATSDAAYEGLIRGLKRRISLRFKGNNVISIACEGKDAKETQDIVLTLTDIIIQKNVASQEEDANSAIDFISKQLEHYRGKLEEAEVKLRDFQEVYTVQLPVITELNDRLVSLQIQLNTILIENTEEHPAVIALKKRIEIVKGDIDQESQRLLRKGIDVEQDKYVEIAQSIPRQQQEYQRLMRDRKVNESLYQLLLERLENAQISKKLDATNEATKFKVIEPARLPLAPTKPDKPRIIILGFGMGFALGAGIVFLKEFMTNAYRNANQLKNEFNLPVLGSISGIHASNFADPEKIEIGVKEKPQTEETFDGELIGKPSKRQLQLILGIATVIVIVFGASAMYMRSNDMDVEKITKKTKKLLKTKLKKERLDRLEGI